MRARKVWRESSLCRTLKERYGDLLERVSKTGRPRGPLQKRRPGAADGSSAQMRTLPSTPSEPTRLG